MEKLTQQEEEAMLTIWETGGGFIKDFLEQMPEPKPPLYHAGLYGEELREERLFGERKAG